MIALECLVAVSSLAACGAHAVPTGNDAATATSRAGPTHVREDQALAGPGPRSLTYLETSNG
jgi:hypothetical protein